MKRLASLALAAAVLGGAAGARADVEAGREHYRTGVKHYKAGAFAAALVEFNAAEAEAPSPRIQFNIGQTCVELKDYACAMIAFEKVIAAPPNETSAEQRATARTETKRLKPFVSYIFITVNVDGAEVTVDDGRAGVSKLAAPILVSAGRHTFAATKGSLFPARRAIEVPGGADHIDVQLDLVEPPPPPPPKILFVTKPEEKSRTPLWIGLATTGVLAAATTTFGILTLGAQSNLEDKVGSIPVTRAQIDSAQSKQDTLALVTDITLGATIIAAGITTVILLLRR